jgi:vesicle coat complex subunit
MHKTRDSNPSSGGNVYFQNSKNTEIAELQADLNTMELEKQKEAMKQIIASMTIGKDVSALFPHVVKCMRTKNIELKKLIYLYIINYAKVKPDLTFLAVAAFHSDAMDKTSPLIRALAVRTMGCIRVNMIVSYLCETLTNCLKDEDPYVRKTACMCVAKLYNTSPGLVKENGFITILSNMLNDGNSLVVANALAALTEISTLSGENLIKIRSKVLKRILLALNEANEWGQVYILDALTSFTPKKSKQAEDIIESVLPRLSHANPSVVMSAVKVILKFLDWIESIETVRNYCKKLSNSLMTIMMAGPEIQYVLLRSLHAVVQKRPYLLDKDFKFFYVQYNDPIYVKLEKIDILYKLCDNKNYESIINELKSYAILECDLDFVKRAIRYIGFIGYKFEKAVDLCVSSLQEILEHNQDYTLSEGVMVARDLMRKYRGRSLELLKKIDEDFIKSIYDPEAKAAVLFILGEFCTYIKNSTELITPFVENFNEETNSSVKLQILNSVIKNFVNKPDETEELVKVCLQKGGEESENPDVRDRSFIYWRLLETNPDIAKEMITGEKAPFEFRDEVNFEGEIVDNIIENMTNVSAVYHKISGDLILKEDMVIDTSEANNEDDKSTVTSTATPSSTSTSANAVNNKPKKITPISNSVQAPKENMDADLLGLDDDNNQMSNVVNNMMKNNTDPSNFFEMLGSFSAGTKQEIDVNDFGFVDNDNTFNNFNESSITVNIFDNSTGVNTINPVLVHKSSLISVHACFHRENSKILLGLFIVNKTSTNLNRFPVQFSNNSFGLSPSSVVYSPNSIAQNSGDKIIYSIEIDNSKNDKKPPSAAYKITAKLSTDVEEAIINIPLNVNVLFVESGKLANKPFVDFFSANKDNNFNITQVFTNLNFVTNEENLNKRLERNNIFLVAKQNKFDPPLIYYSCSISSAIPIILECSFLKQQNGLKIRIIAGIECVANLMKEVVDLIIN